MKFDKNTLLGCRSIRNMYWI